MAKTKIEIGDILLFLSLLLIAFLRLWKAVDWFSFNFDEEYQAFLAWSQVLNFHPIWIGVSASNFGFYLGPGFTYLNALLFKISSGDLVSLAIFSPMLGIITCLSVYYTISKTFSRKAAFFSILIYGLSTLMNIFDRRFWNPTPIPFLTVWLLYSLYKTNKDSRWFILTATLMAASLHIHLSLIAFWPLVLYVVIKNIKKISPKVWIFSLVSYLLIISPLIIFDINHNYDNLLSPIRYLLSPGQIESSFNLSVIPKNLPTIWGALSRIWFIKPFTTIQDEMALGVHGSVTRGYWPLSVFSLIILVWLFMKQTKDSKLRILFFATISILSAYLIYPGAAAEYFLLGFFTLFTIVAGIFLSRIPLKLSSVLAGIFISFSTFSILTINQSRFGLTIRKELIKETMLIIKGDPFVVEVATIGKTDYPQYAGWCFLYRIYGRIPIKCQANNYFGWILNEKSSETKPIYKVVISEDYEYTSVVKPIKYIHEGAYNIYVYSINQYAKTF